MPDQYIFHLVKWYPNKADDLEGVFIQRHIASTNAYYNSVVIYARAIDTIESNRLTSFTEERNKGIIEFVGYYQKRITGFSVIDKLLKFLLYYFLMLKLVNRAIKKFDKPVLINVHVLFRPAILAFWYFKFYKIPYIITEHATYFTEGRNVPSYSLKNALRKLIVKNAKAVVTVSRDLEEGMRRFGLSNRYFRIFNCVNTVKFHYVEKTEKDCVQLLHVSEFKNKHKNIIGLLEVINRLSKNIQPFEFHLVGYGQDLNEILEFIETNHLKKWIVFHGKLKEDELAKLYSAADVFVLFSNKENMPCVIAESLCSGTPVISTKVGGIPEVISDKNGILIDKSDQEHLYNSIIDVIKGNKKFDYEKISDDAMQLFSFESVGVQFSRVYEYALSKVKDG